MKVFQFHPKVKYPSFFGSRVCSDWMPVASSEFFFQKAWLYLPQTRCNVLLWAQQLPCHLLDPFADMLPRFVTNKLYANSRKMSLGVENQTISRDTVNSLTSSKLSHSPTLHYMKLTSRPFSVTKEFSWNSFWNMFYNCFDMHATICVTFHSDRHSFCQIALLKKSMPIFF